MLPSNILDLINKKNIADKLQSVVSECSRENNDDATILILRRNDFPKGFKPLYQETILKNLDFKSERLYGHLLTDCAVELIEHNINKKDWEVVKRCLDYIYINKLLPTREILISWLDKIVEQQVNNRDILLNIRKLIQIS